jgi:hypothetical protein
VREALLTHRDEARDLLRPFAPTITFTPYGSGRGTGGATPSRRSAPTAGSSEKHADRMVVADGIASA